MTKCEQGDEWKVQGLELIEKCVAEAKTMPGCVAFAINNEWGVHFYKDKCYPLDTDEAGEWITYELSDPALILAPA